MATETITVGTVKHAAWVKTARKEGDIMITTSPYHTESSTAYPELEGSRNALLIPEEVTSAQVQEERLTATEDPAEFCVPPRKQALAARIARGFLAFYDWLSEPPTTHRDRVKEDIAEARSQWYGRLEQAKLS